jgi:hypothetical protein
VNRDSPRTCHRERRHPVAERLQMLCGSRRRRHQHRYLLAVLHRLERRAHGDLGLAIADVADDHPVHRNRLLHVGLDLARSTVNWSTVSVNANASSISRCHGRVRAERMPGRGLTRRVELHQLARDLANRLARLALGVCPVGTTELAAARRLSHRRSGESWSSESIGTNRPVAGMAALARAYSMHQVLATRPTEVRSTISTNRPMPC